MTNSHISTYKYGVYGNDCGWFMITGNLFFKREDSNENHQDIALVDSSDNTIIGNTFHVAGPTEGDQNAIILVRSTLNTIIGNVFRGKDTDIW
ncbi:unnamed protein product, partial [marine sediment metagenome]